jgi:hypothetical protein
MRLTITNPESLELPFRSEWTEEQYIWKSKTNKFIVTLYRNPTPNDDYQIEINTPYSNWITKIPLPTDRSKLQELILKYIQAYHPLKYKKRIKE